MRISTLLATTLLASAVSAQTFNIDIEHSSAPSATPASTYGAVAGEPGPWNLAQLTAGSLPPTTLTATCGTATSVTIEASSSVGIVPTAAASCGTWGTGTDELALYDGITSTPSPGTTTFTITGLLAGNYRIFLYASSTSASTTSFSAGGVATGFANSCPTSPAVHEFSATYEFLDVVIAPSGTLVIVVGSAMPMTVFAASAIQIVRTSRTVGENFCIPSTNSTGAPAIIAAAATACNGEVSIAANDLILSAAPVPFGQNEYGFFFYSATTLGPIPANDGYRCVTNSMCKLMIPQHTGQRATYAVDFANLPCAIAPGQTRYFQYFFTDPAAGMTGANFSDAIEISFTN